MTRTEWFTSSLEQMKLVRREGGGDRSGHKMYKMSEADHATP